MFEPGWGSIHFFGEGCFVICCLLRVSATQPKSSLTRSFTFSADDHDLLVLIVSSKICIVSFKNKSLRMSLFL